MDGWIKLHRKILENPIVCKDSDYLTIWVYLLLNATHKEYPALFNGKRIILKPGQLITGRKSISEKFNISESKVQRILKCFEIEQQIEQQNGNRNRLITVLSWSSYQADEQLIEQPVNNKRTTDEQQVNTNKNVKNDKNVKNVKNNNISYQFDEIIKDFTNETDLQNILIEFIQYRKEIKKSIKSEKSLKLFLEQLNGLSSDSLVKIQILKKSMANGWQGIFPLKDKEGQKGITKEKPASFEDIE